MYGQNKKYQQLGFKSLNPLQQENKSHQRSGKDNTSFLLQDLRKITSYDIGKPTAVTFELFQSDRFDYYQVFVNGSLEKTRRQ